MQPVERPTYRIDDDGQVARFEVDASTFPALVTVAALALSDAIRPLGQFEVWTARRVTAKGASAAEVVEKWLATLLQDADASAFLPVLVEMERAEATRANGIHRGGIAPEDAGPPARRFEAVVPGSTVVEAGGADRPWRARFSARHAT